jgi:ATP-dependent Clp protease ATP-binding subunit ClpC
MFERYTEQARRSLFFARYESSLLGSPSIVPEHLLLGILRGGQDLGDLIPSTTADRIREQLLQQMPRGEVEASHYMRCHDSPRRTSVL